MNLTQTLISLPGQATVIANASSAAHTGIVSAVATSAVPGGTLVNTDMTGSIIPAGFDAVLESVLANALIGNEIGQNTNPDLLTLLTGAPLPVVGMPTGPLPITAAVTPAILMGHADISGIAPDYPEEDNIAPAISNADGEELAEALWPWPLNTAPVADDFVMSPTLVMQPADVTEPQLTIINAAPAAQMPAPQIIAPDIAAAPLQAVTAYEAAAAYGLGDTKLNTIPTTKSDSALAPISEFSTGPVPNSEANVAPRQTFASVTPPQPSFDAPQTASMDISGSTTAYPIEMTDEAGKATVEKSPILSGGASETAANAQTRSAPDQLTVPQTATTLPPLTAPILAVAAVTPANKKTTPAEKNQVNSGGDTIAPQNGQSAASISKRPPADIQVEAPSSGGAPDSAAPGNASAPPTPGDANQTTPQNAPLISVAPASPQSSAPVEISSTSPAGREPTSPDTVQPASEQTAPRSNAAPPSIAAAQLTPGHNAAAPQPVAAGGQNFVQTMEQLSDALPDAASLAPQPGAPDMVQGPTGNAAQIDKQDALRTALPQTAPRSETPPAPVSPPIRDIAVHISQHADTGVNRFQLRLDPPELGRVDVRMEVSSEGKLSAVIAVERPETLDLLQRDSRALEKSLAEAGLKTDSNSLSFSLKGGRHENQNTDGSRPGHGGADNSLTEDWDEPIAPMAMRFANRSVNIRI
jgi:flagellar hook-length control protein FliK